MSGPRTLASAVVVPGAEASRRNSQQSLKRRRSSVSEHEDAKKIKLESQSNDSTVIPSAARISTATSSSTHPSTGPPKQEADLKEKRRVSRLFGNVIGSLQGNKTAAQKKREDIERRQKAKLKAQEAEQSQAQQEKMEKLKAIREREQKRIDVENMKAKHDAIRARAEHLYTDAQPRLHFKPYQLLPEQEDQILRQREEVEAKIARELEEYEKKKTAGADQAQREDNGQASVQVKSETDGSKTVEPRGSELIEKEMLSNRDRSDVGAAHINGVAPSSDEPANEELQQATDQSPPPATSGAQNSNNEQLQDDNEQVSEQDQDQDHDHEMVVETEEDTVIY